MVKARKIRAPRIVAQGEGLPGWLRAALLLIAGAAIAWFVCQRVGVDGNGGLGALGPDAGHQLRVLEEERNALRRELVMVKQDAEVDRESIASIRERIKQLQDERLKMEEELAFLRGIVSTTSKKHALRVQNFKLEPGLEEGQYLYRFSVTQVINSGIVAKGVIEIRVEGLQDGRARVLQLVEISEDKTRHVKMRFRYFQNVEGKLQLPDGFEPASFNIEVKPGGDKLETVKESFNWPAVS